MSMNHSTRRDFLRTGAAFGATAAAGLPLHRARAAGSEAKLGKAEHCVVIWLGGGPGQIDTFDPKPKGDPKKNKPGGYYESIPTAIPGAKVCEHLNKTAPLLDRFALLRTVSHDAVDEHGAATNRMHTGRPTSGTIVYPSLGSMVSKQKGPLNDKAPSYVVIGYPNVSRGPGFLGAEHAFLYLTDTERGPVALTRPPGIDQKRQQRRSELLKVMRNGGGSGEAAERKVEDYQRMLARAQRLSGPEFMKVFQLDKEPKSLRQRYGSEIGQRCLLARRLIQSGVRFVEVSHNLGFANGTGWDVHRDGILKQHVLIQELDDALSTLTQDLEKKGLLDKTLIMIAGEFGRPGGFDGAGGRGHHADAFSVVLGGAGLNGQVIGETDDRAEQAVDRSVPVADLFATVFAKLGVDPDQDMHAGDRPVPLTDDAEGKPVPELLA